MRWWSKSSGTHCIYSEFRVPNAATLLTMLWWSMAGCYADETYMYAYALMSKSNWYAVSC